MVSYTMTLPGLLNNVTTPGSSSFKASSMEKSNWDFVKSKLGNLLEYVFNACILHNVFPYFK